MLSALLSLQYNYIEYEQRPVERSASYSKAFFQTRGVSKLKNRNSSCGRAKDNFYL